jgi:phosphotriesterase-related protein
MLLSRKKFLLITAGGLLGMGKKTEVVMTVRGPVPAGQLGRTLVHEHFLVDFIGADKITSDRWERGAVLHKVMPYLDELREFNVKTIFDCTPAYLGRDVQLLKMISDKSGLHIVTNTGYYGAVDNKYLPPHAFTETAQQLAARWTREFEQGIESSGIRPGFIKIGVNPGPLSSLHQKLVRAAGLTHKATGLTICSHTGKALPAFEEIAILESMGVDPVAFVWVHAQEENDAIAYSRAIQKHSWVSLDGIAWGPVEKYAEWLLALKQKGMLNGALLSHDAGWYQPGEGDGGNYRGYTNIFKQLFPLLLKKGFTENDLDQLLIKNPAKAFAISS